MTRTDARELLMQLIFQMEIQEDYSDEAKDLFLKGKHNLKDQMAYFNEVFRLIVEKKDEIAETFEKHSNIRKFNRLSKVDSSIFKIAIVEILYIDDIPNPVSVNEAVELAKKYSTDESARLINAILFNVAKNKNE